MNFIEKIKTEQETVKQELQEKYPNIVIEPNVSIAYHIGRFIGSFALSVLLVMGFIFMFYFVLRFCQFA